MVHYEFTLTKFSWPIFFLQILAANTCDRYFSINTLYLNHTIVSDNVVSKTLTCLYNIIFFNTLNFFYSIQKEWLFACMLLFFSNLHFKLEKKLDK